MLSLPSKYLYQDYIILFSCFSLAHGFFKILFFSFFFDQLSNTHKQKKIHPILPILKKEKQKKTFQSSFASVFFYIKTL